MNVLDSSLKRIIAFSFAVILYSLSAGLPFISLVSGNPFLHYLLGIVISILTATIWVFISRNTPKDNMVFTGLLYDTLLTTCFIVIPLVLQRKMLQPMQVVGVVLVLVGLILFKGI